MSIVILAEKPNQAKSYAEAFKKSVTKDGYLEITDSTFFKEKVYLTWGYGHLVSLVEPGKYKEEWEKWDLKDLPLFPDKFKFEVSSDKKKQFRIVSGLLKEATEIIIATDSDREGENIAYSIIKAAGSIQKPIKRLWINSLEASEVQKGFRNLRPGKETYNFYIEALTRQCSDWLIGMNISRLYTLLFHEKGLKGNYSLGRVQTPTLYLINDRIKEIENFKSQKFYELYLDVKVKNGNFKAKYDGKYDKKSDINEILNKCGVQEENEAVIESLQKELKIQKSPKLYSLSTLQTKANNKWKYSPKKVLEIMQSLYLKKLLSYPRTDCNYVTENEFDYLAKNLGQYQRLINKSFLIAFKEPQSRYVNNKKVQEHTAIIPTKMIPSDGALTELTAEEKNIYFEVVLNTISMFAENYEYEETKVNVNINGLVFSASGKIEKNKGWKALFDLEQDAADENNKEENQKLPLMFEGEKGTSNIIIHEGITKPPKMYTEGNLINVMKSVGKTVNDEEESKILNEVEGIGTEATRAQIIETLKSQEYIEVTKNIVGITKKGEMLCEAVKGTLISSAEMTAKWESDLKKIGNGQGRQMDFFIGVKKFIQDQINQTSDKIKNGTMDNKINETRDADILCKCPICGGNIRENQKAYSCDRWKEGCEFTIWKMQYGKKLTEKQVIQLIEKGKTNVIKGFKKKNGDTYSAALKLDGTNVSRTF